MKLHGFKRATPDEPTFRGISTIDNCISRHPMNSQYPYRAGLEHAGVFFRLHADLPLDMMRKQPDWNRCEDNEFAVELCGLSRHALHKRWGELRSLVDGLPRRRTGPGRCKFWNNELEKMRLDVRRAHRSIDRHPENRTAYNLVRCIYRTSLLQYQYDHIRTVLTKARDPAVFRLVQQLKTRTTLPSMVDDRRVISSHDGISDLMAGQLSPGPAIPWVTNTIHIEPADELESPIRRSPGNTSPSLDDIGYPLIRLWARSNMETLRGLVSYGLKFDIPDWHEAEVVLIPKAAKLRYHIVKS